jgi:serine/threonine protein kinase/Tol biopolymer transport system component
MTPERWRQVKEIFHSALECAPGERAAYLRRACAGQDSLRLEVEALIFSHEKTGSFINTPAYEKAAALIADEHVELMTGEHLGSFEILSTLGRGGMGEVYLAEDKRLGRRVALKLLPASYTKDKDRLHRFEQEARAASSLNHPNILTIYEIGQTEETHFIVTEYIEGETLRERLARAPVSLSHSLEIGMQVASALSAARSAGIIHRDIKPENIMLRTDGYVKVLDFGLAKLTGRDDATDTEAATRVLTSPGMVMGTASYMSPEQARGLAVDARTDIWSLGVVLYEMLAGRVPFEGQTPSDVISLILQKEPPPLSRHLPDVPHELERIVMKALHKDPEERYQTVKDLALDLKSLKQELEFEARLERSVTSDKPISLASDTARNSAPLARTQTDELQGRTTTTTVEALPVAKSYGRLIVATGLLLALLAVGVALAFGLYRYFKQDKSPARFQAMNMTRLTNSGKAIDGAISPDGSYFVYVLSDAGKQSLWLRQVAAANDTQIVPPAPVGYFGVAFTRDGNDLYYALKSNNTPGILYRVPALGGTPVKLLENIDSPVSFSPDGKRFAFVRGDWPNKGESGIYIARTEGSGEPQPLITRKLPELFYPNFFTGPSWSPDGQLVACSLITVGVGTSVLVVSVQDGKEQVVTKERWSNVGRVEWLSNMSGLIMVAGNRETANNQVWHLSYPGGEARRITNDLNGYRAVAMTADSTKFVTVQTTGMMSIWVAPDGDTRRAAQLPTGNKGFFGSGNDTVSWTPDGKIVYVSGTSNRQNIWIIDSAGGSPKQLTTNASNNHSPEVSRDGRYIVFTSTRSGKRNVWRMDVDGSNPQQLTSSLLDFTPTVSPDSRWVIYSSFMSEKLSLWKIPIDGGTPVKITDRDATRPAVSPDGKLIAYLHSEGAGLLASNAPVNRIAIISFDGGEPIKTFEMPQSGVIAPDLHWSLDGRSLLYTVNKNNVTNIWSQPLDGGQPKQVTDFKEDFIQAFDWSRDNRLACSRGILVRDIVLISESK